MEESGVTLMVVQGSKDQQQLISLWQALHISIKSQLIEQYLRQDMEKESLIQSMEQPRLC